MPKLRSTASTLVSFPAKMDRRSNLSAFAFKSICGEHRSQHRASIRRRMGSIATHKAESEGLYFLRRASVTWPCFHASGEGFLHLLHFLVHHL